MAQKILNKILICLVCLLPLIYIPSDFILSNALLKTIYIYLCSIIIVFLCCRIGFKKIDKIDIFLIAFYLLNLLSLCFSVDKQLSIYGITYSERYDGIIMLSAYLLIYYASKYYYQISKIDISMFFISGTIVCLIGIYQFVTFSQSNTNSPYTETVLSSTLGNSNFVGSYLTFFIPALVTMYFLKGKLRYLLLCIIFLATLVLSTARSAWIGIALFFPFLIVFLIKNFERKQLKNYIVILICFILICIATIVLEQITGNHIITHKLNNLIQDIINLGHFNVSLEMGTARLKIWDMVFNVIKNKPFLGTGPETLPLGLDTYSHEPFRKWIKESSTFIDKAHNDYLQIAACTGIPSLVFYILFLILILNSFRKNMLKNKISIIFFGIIFAYIVQAFFNISVISVAPVFWFILGISQNKEVHKTLNELYKD